MIVRMFLICGFLGGFGAPHWALALFISGAFGTLLYLDLRDEFGWFPIIK